jgi:hypothetical protein
MINKTIPLVTGQIVCETNYPELGLKYYGVKYYNLTLKCFDIVFIEESQLQKIQNMESNQSCNHINSHNLSSSPFID